MSDYLAADYQDFNPTIPAGGDVGVKDTPPPSAGRIKPAPTLGSTAQCDSRKRSRSSRAQWTQSERMSLKGVCSCRCRVRGGHGEKRGERPKRRPPLRGVRGARRCLYLSGLLSQHRRKENQGAGRDKAPRSGPRGERKLHAVGLSGEHQGGSVGVSPVLYPAQYSAQAEKSRPKEGGPGGTLFPQQRSPGTPSSCPQQQLPRRMGGTPRERTIHARSGLPTHVTANPALPRNVGTRQNRQEIHQKKLEENKRRYWWSLKTGVEDEIADAKKARKHEEVLSRGGMTHGGSSRFTNYSAGDKVHVAGGTTTLNRTVGWQLALPVYITYNFQQGLNVAFDLGLGDLIGAWGISWINRENSGPKNWGQDLIKPSRKIGATINLPS
ncbi:hypothetical protein B0H14DRAFT_2631619 [Mycena olivaceomarginata]|nr:hypothetical protein B0H14DRAFT_2631619 [Mycena olivaceomarginata]